MKKPRPAPRRRQSQPVKPTPALLLGDGLLLFLALTGCVSFFVTTYRIEADLPSLWGVCLLACALFLLIFSLPRLRWAALLLAAGVFALVLWIGRAHV